MTEYFNDLNKMSDEQLITIKNGQTPYFLSAQSTTTKQDVMIEAETILHRRQREYENKNLLLQGKNLSLQNWIFRLTIAILILTAIAVVFAVLSYKPFDVQPHKDRTQPQQENYNQQSGILKPMNKIPK